ncbi:bifunctional uroporphyrinogen-III synthetase/uroporphyrin-III C-methyltransferase [Caballeronia arationis]|jgi:uroporphyrinogen III methyltransferase/synthase|uniref:Uroporphyrinogen III methyltransferase / synthase n=1 Tax=Caballeronia arationis TaxID=1777142 RepID=A0A7Z7IAM9_9BURK|nr:fused uroporphyrinogen-III synthase HemD/membrane protein HemX [Caballeronia arationis]SAK97147.1 bifunctional uroporphyrinogen-III synthetase/uroporphyrin-III C-methyltransferase [Caballeronia arationis]SOE82403.1 uroporphyrinogen III methyltransferase / synthase [Caballeronia arationis]
MTSARRVTIVVTRPIGQSAALLALLADAGFDSLEFPLIDIAPVADDAPLRAALDELYGPVKYALVVFVSPNAVDYAFGKLGAPWPADVPVAVVGPGSVAALARQGVAAPAHRVISPSAESADPRFDSEALYAAIEAQFGATGLEGKRVLIVRGDGGREWLAERLAEAGATVEKVAAYRRIVPEPSMQKWERVHALLAGEPHAWLLTSSEGVRNLDELAREHLSPDETAQLKRAPLVSPHPRIAEAARQAGFDRITVSGAGDERIAESLRTAFAAELQRDAGARSAAETSKGATQSATKVETKTSNAESTPTDSKPAAAPAHQPAQSRMTDSNDSKKASPQPTVTQPLPPNTPFTPYEAQPKKSSAGTALLWLVIVILAVAAGGGGFLLNRKFDRTDQQIAQRLQANDATTADLRAKADQAASSAGALSTQIIQLQGKLNDAEAHSQALQQQYQDLASNRDDWTIAEVEQILSSASQQLQLTGNVQLALFALQSADTRLAAATGPQIVAIRKAIAQDIDKLNATPSTDLTGLAIKLDTAISQVDNLPLAGEAPIERATARAAAPGNSASIAAATGQPRWKVLWQQFVSGIGQQLSSLVSVRRIDNADAMLTSPDQGYFVRENVKLRLLSARLSLLSRSESTLKSDLHAADAALARYFDPSSKKVTSVRDLVKQVDQASLAVAVPNLNESLAAVHQFKRGG